MGLTVNRQVAKKLTVNRQTAFSAPERSGSFGPPLILHTSNSRAEFF